MFTSSLRTKFLLSLALISALITTAVLMVVRYRVQLHVREELTQALDTSVVTFQRLQQQRESTLEQSAALVATLPPLKAIMTSGDAATIQDASQTFWQLAGSDVFALADRDGQLAALHTRTADLKREVAAQLMRRSLADGQSRDWWYGGGHLFQIFLKPIYFGSAEANQPIGVLAVGYDMDASLAIDVSRVASSQVGFGYGDQLVASTVTTSQRADLAAHIAAISRGATGQRDVRLGTEQFLATSVQLPSGRAPYVTLTVLKSYDQATAYLESLNRWIVAVGVAGVLIGSVLVFWVSTTFTHPLNRLVLGVQALERGDFNYPLDISGSDEVSELTVAFDRMRRRLQQTQRQLLDAEQLATIGRMASTISHDLRHPLTAILAYAEFLSEHDLTEGQRKDFHAEIRIAVNRMMDEINSLLGFSAGHTDLHPALARLDEVIDRAVRTVKALPDYESVSLTYHASDDCRAWFDAGKIERVLLNLLFNAAEAVAPESGRVEVSCTVTAQGAEVRVADNGPGIATEIADRVFQPFVSHGKEKGIGLGLTVVQTIMQAHGGQAALERTGPTGTVFLLTFPPPPGDASSRLA